MFVCAGHGRPLEPVGVRSPLLVVVGCSLIAPRCGAGLGERPVRGGADDVVLTSLPLPGGCTSSPNTQYPVDQVPPWCDRASRGGLTRRAQYADADMPSARHERDLESRDDAVLKVRYDGRWNSMAWSGPLYAL
jgi:hypothetical protein